MKRAASIVFFLLALAVAIFLFFVEVKTAAEEREVREQERLMRATQVSQDWRRDIRHCLGDDIDTWGCIINEKSDDNHSLN